jgi:hypothetical protein
VFVADLAGRDRDEAREPRLRRERVVERPVEPAVDDVVADREQPALGITEKVEVHLLDEVVGEIRQPLGAFPKLLRVRLRQRERDPMFGECRGDPFEPRPCLRDRRLVPAGERHVLQFSECAPDAGQVVLDRGQQRGPFGRGRGTLRQRPVKSVDLLGQRGSMVAAALVPGTAEARLGKAQAVAHPVERTHVHAWLVHQLLQPHAHGQEVSRQVAAVDARDVLGQQRRERPRVVPVVEMPAIPLKLQQRPESWFEAIDDAGGAQVPEVVGRERRDELQADVRR